MQNLTGKVAGHDTTLCKYILNEFTFKNKMKPKYNMRCHAKGQSLVFICHLAFGSKTYMGKDVGIRKWLSI